MSDFWSRRKRAVDAAEDADRKAEAAARGAVERTEREAVQAEMTEAELLASLNLPDPDQAKSGDDIAAFLVEAVPRHIRNRALRSLWRSNPVLACVDGLNDYDGDFTGNGLNGGVLRTSYQVGKGLTAHVEKMAREAVQKDGGEPVGSSADDEEREAPTDGVTQNFLDESPPDPDGMHMDAEPEEGAVSFVEPPKRMRFTFEEDDHDERQRPRPTGSASI